MPLAELSIHGKLEGLSDQTVKDMHRALRLEYEDKFHYECGKDNANSKTNSLILDQLSKHERRHAHAIEEMLGIEDAEIEKPANPCIGIKDINTEGFDEQVFQVGLKRERDAIKFYTKIAQESDHPRVKEVFYALAEVEYEHALLNKLLS